MTELAQVEPKRLDEIKRLMDEIEIETDCPPTLIGAINTVAASGGNPSEEAIKLVILKNRKVIDQEEYLELISHFVEIKFAKNRRNGF